VEEKKIGIESLFCPVLTNRDTILSDLLLWWAIGVRSLSLSFTQDSGDLSIFIGIAREVGFKIILPTAGAWYTGWDEDKWVADTQVMAQTLLKYKPDGWYGCMEFSIGWKGYGTAYQKVIPILRGLRDVPIYLSPFYGAGPPVPSDSDVRDVLESFCSTIGQANIISALQDGVGCDGNLPRRVIGGPVHQDWLNKAKIHKEVVESHGGKATINVELFDTYPQTPGGVAYPATTDRIKTQIEAENKPEYVSKGLGLGPCCSAEGISLREYQMAWYPFHNEVAQMLLKMKGGSL
jgi:hypothetical protein